MLPPSPAPSCRLYFLMAACSVMISGTVRADTVELAAQPFPLSSVKLLDSPFKSNMERNAEYLLSLEPDRLLHNTREYAGLKPKGELYGGWEAKGIAGHTLGHYLTALSQQYAATGDPRFKERVDYIVSEMAECQKAYGDGYIGALPPKELETMRNFGKGIVDPSSAFNFRGGAWVPWYTEHKVLAGLIDAWTRCKNDQAKAVAIKLGDWVDDITRGLSPEQQQKMLQVEHGGMLESLVLLYELTGNQKYLSASQRFYQKAIFDPLLSGRDELNGKHANTQIPKIIGEARFYEATGDQDGRKIAEFFWDTVVHNRSWVIGANSDHEHFFPVGDAARHLGPQTAESCNTYNMLKLTEHLFEWKPSVEKADFYERALFNHILGTQDPQKGMFTYFMSLKPGHFKVFSTPDNSFWCCVGSGMENHTKYGEAIYFHGADSLYVNLFIPSILTWKEAGLVLRQETSFPNEDFSEFTFEEAPPKPLKLLVRCPAWAAGPVSFQVNGQPLEVAAKPGEYAEITRDWKKGDRLKVTTPMSVHTESLEGDPRKIAILYGPIVLAGDLGPVPETATFPYSADHTKNDNVAGADVPSMVHAGGDISPLVKRVPGKELAFQTEGLMEPSNITLRPYAGIFYDYYNVYWDVFTPEEWKTKEAEVATETARRKADEARIVDSVDFGMQQSEVDHNVTSDRSKTGDFRNQKWRDASSGGFIEFKAKVIPDTPLLLRCRYWGEDRGREFSILVDGKAIGDEKLDRNAPGKFFNQDYPIPSELVQGKDSITVRFEPKQGSVAGGFYNASILKAK